MALRMNISSSSIGVPFTDAYAKIHLFRGDKTKLYFTVQWFASAAARQTESASVASHEYQVDFDTIQGDLLPALYNWLKLQPEFADAVDC